MKSTLKPAAATQCAAHFLIILLAFAVGLAAQEVLTNDAIVSMTKAGLSGKLIVEKIQSTPGKYVVTSSALIALEQQGVPDDTIAAMMAKMAPSSEPKPTQARQTGQPTEPVFGEWTVVPTRDEILRTSSFEGRMKAKAGEEGSFEVFATCDDNLTFRVRYLRSSGSNPGFLLSNGDIILPGAHVVMRMSVDGTAKEVFSKTSKFSNEATIRFDNNILAFMSPAIYNANSIKIEFPLADGGLPILEIKPQEAGFQQFAARCAAVKAGAARAEQELQKVEQAKKDENTIKRSGPYIQKYGLPSIYDAFSTLNTKVRQLGDVQLAAYVGVQLYRAPLQELASKVAAGAPGSACSALRIPGDVSPETINWDAKEPQYVLVRCETDNQWVWGQMILMPEGLEELKKRRTRLLEFGVKDVPAPSDSSVPENAPPKPWTLGTLQARQFYVCPDKQLYGPAHDKESAFSPGQPTPVWIVDRPTVSSYLIKVDRTAALSYEADWSDLHESGEFCQSVTSNVSTNVRTSTVAPTANLTGLPNQLAELTIVGQFARALTHGRYWLLASDPVVTLRQQPGLRIQPGNTSSEIIRSECAKGQGPCQSILAIFDRNAVTKGVVDSKGNTKLQAVTAGNYHLVLVAVYDDRVISWNEQLALSPGPNSKQFSISTLQK